MRSDVPDPILAPTSCNNAAGEGKGRHFKTHERVPVIVNKVGPFNNPSETYQYYSLPFCKEGRGGVSRRTRHGLGELLVGDRKVRGEGWGGGGWWWWHESAADSIGLAE